MLMVPIPRIGAAIRPATVDDIPFIDQLQKMQRDRVGFMCTSWIEARIEARQVLVADAAGYIIASDRYFKRDDCGIIYQINVAPGAQRHLIGAALVKAQFERSAYGCRLYCCWCAQDIEANRFWESLGFIPLAYRAGSEKKNKGGRVHIFWQRRVRADDHQTPY